MSERKTRVAIVSGENNGSGYYRAVLVKRGLDRLGGNVEAYFTDRWSETMDGAIDVLYLVHPRRATIDIQRVHELQRDGVAVVLDCDDLVFDVPAYSQAYLPSKAAGWREYRAALHQTADIVTVTTRAMGEALREIGEAPGVVDVIPNAFDTSIKYLQPQAKQGTRPVIGWFGGGQHHGDLDAMRDVFEAILAEGWGLVFFGSAPSQYLGVTWRTHGKRVVTIAGCDEPERYFGLAGMTGIDVGLAPLLPNAFNRCKSEIKPLEYRYLCGAPCVASDIEPYRPLVHDRIGLRLVDGFDPGAWLPAIREALRDGPKRYHLPARFNLDIVSRAWANTFRRAHAMTGGLR